MTDTTNRELDYQKPHSAKVEALAGYGIPSADIATVLAIDEQELKFTYRSELESGHIKANARVAESLFRKATGEGREAVTAAIFWAKTRMGWREKGEATPKEPTEVVIRRFGVDWEPAEPTNDIGRAPSHHLGHARHEIDI